ncbi:MAG TPA: hypothetical protein VLA40_01410, partial [Rheinheimera sp.]|nr:hypothetical protein [Rheinheimera sp.]
MMNKRNTVLAAMSVGCFALSLTSVAVAEGVKKQPTDIAATTVTEVRLSAKQPTDIAASTVFLLFIIV